MSFSASMPCTAVHPLNELVLVDDDKLTLEIVSWILRKTSYASKLFTDTEEAMAYLKVNTPRLLVVDFYMPCMSGLEFLSELYACTDLTQSAVFLCSAVPPPKSSGEKFAEMCVEILEKEQICDKARLGMLLEKYLEPCATQDSSEPVSDKKR